MDSEPSRVSRVPDIPAVKPPNQYGDQYLADLAGMVGLFLGPNADTVVEYGTGASTGVLAEALAKRQGDGSPAILLSIDHNGVVVTFVPKVPIWKAHYFNGLRQASCDNLLISR
jgi:hypothetical protein